MHIREFHRQVDRFTREIISFDDHRALDQAAITHISAKRSIFVYTHEVADFIEHVWPQLHGDHYVLITHNSDYEVDASYLPFLDTSRRKLQRWFAQNAVVEHPKLEPLPIGIANSMWKHGNLRLLERAISEAATRPKTELIYLQFNPKTHPDRRRIWEALRPAFPRLSAAPPPPRRFRSYLAELARYRYCVCPRGNGIDTHRLWECLYLGVTPILERSLHTEHWRRLGLPVMLVDDWTEVTAQRLEDHPHQAERPPVALAALRISYYSQLVRQAAEDVSSLVDGTQAKSGH